MLLKRDLNSQPWEKLAVHDCGHFPVLRHLGLCNNQSDYTFWCLMMTLTSHPCLFSSALHLGKMLRTHRYSLLWCWMRASILTNSAKPLSQLGPHPAKGLKSPGQSPCPVGSRKSQLSRKWMFHDLLGGVCVCSLVSTFKSNFGGGSSEFYTIALIV